MSYKPKTRFVVKVPNGLYGILSVRERPNGELQLLHVLDRNHENEDGTDTKILSEKHSIHPSSNSFGITIKRTNPLDDGRYLTSSSFIHTDNGKILYPIMARSLSKFDPARHSANIRSRDRLIYLPEYDCDTATMFSIIVVSDLDTEIPNYPESGLNLTCAEFSMFRVGVYTGFINIASFILNVVSHIATSPQQDTPTPVRPDSGGTHSFSTERLMDFLDFISCSICYRLNNRLLSFFQGHGRPTEFLDTPNCFMVTRNPLIDFEDDSDQGPIILTSSLPKRDGAVGVVISTRDKPIGKLFYNLV